MSHASASWSTSELLRETSWMRGLALRLAGGEEAEDLVQDAVVAALEAQPSANRPLRPWLAQVLKKRLAFLRRSRGRRRERELTRAGADVVPPVDELLERAELHGRLVQAVMHLAEPASKTLPRAATSPRSRKD